MCNFLLTIALSFLNYFEINVSFFCNLQNLYVLGFNTMKTIHEGIIRFHLAKIKAKAVKKAWLKIFQSYVYYPA